VQDDKDATAGDFTFATKGRVFDVGLTKEQMSIVMVCDPVKRPARNTLSNVTQRNPADILLPADNAS
jgi:hypothetical protein